MKIEKLGILILHMCVLGKPLCLSRLEKLQPLQDKLVSQDSLVSVLVSVCNHLNFVIIRTLFPFWSLGFGMAFHLNFKPEKLNAQ
jgi:hypothetical protein